MQISSFVSDWIQRYGVSQFRTMEGANSKQMRTFYIERKLPSPYNSYVVLKNKWILQQCCMFVDSNIFILWVHILDVCGSLCNLASGKQMFVTILKDPNWDFWHRGMCLCMSKDKPVLWNAMVTQGVPQGTPWSTF